MVENARQRSITDPTGESTRGWSVKGKMTTFSEALISQWSYGTRKNSGKDRSGGVFKIEYHVPLLEGGKQQ